MKNYYRHGELIIESISEIEGNSLIKVYTSASTSKISGAPGLFDVTLKPSTDGDGEPLDTFRVGAIIQATGWKPKDPRDSLAYGQLEDIVLNVDLEEMVRKDGRITRPSDGREVKKIAFIQCGGSRAKEHHSHCSSICCLTSLKQAPVVAPEFVYFLSMAVGDFLHGSRDYGVIGSNELLGVFADT